MCNINLSINLIFNKAGFGKKAFQNCGMGTEKTVPRKPINKKTKTKVLHIIDSVLEPLVPISLRQAEYFVNLDASKLLSKSTLYDLGGHRMRIFHQVKKL